MGTKGSSYGYGFNKPRRDLRAVSTDNKGQDPENQLMQLRAWCDRIGYVVVHEYVDHESGVTGADCGFRGKSPANPR